MDFTITALPGADFATIEEAQATTLDTLASLIAETIQRHLDAGRLIMEENDDWDWVGQTTEPMV